MDRVSSDVVFDVLQMAPGADHSQITDPLPEGEVLEVFPA